MHGSCWLWWSNWIIRCRYSCIPIPDLGTARLSSSFQAGIEYRLHHVFSRYIPVCVEIELAKVFCPTIWNSSGKYIDGKVSRFYRPWELLDWSR